MTSPGGAGAAWSLSTWAGTDVVTSGGDQHVRLGEAPPQGMRGEKPRGSERFSARGKQLPVAFAGVLARPAAPGFPAITRPRSWSKTPAPERDPSPQGGCVSSSLQGVLGSQTRRWQGLSRPGRGDPGLHGLRRAEGQARGLGTANLKCHPFLDPADLETLWENKTDRRAVRLLPQSTHSHPRGAAGATAQGPDAGS